MKILLALLSVISFHAPAHREVWAFCGRSEGRAVNADRLFEVPDLVPGEPEEKLSAGQRLTIRNNTRLERGVHPLALGPLDPNPDHPCGNCAHHVVRIYSKHYHKCRLNETGGPATDLRLGWPGCMAWVEDPQ